MNRTKSFRDQHDELLTLASEVSDQLNVEELSKDASEIVITLTKLLRKLHIHLAIEDKSLYPRLLEHSDETVRSMAKAFIEEMGGIAKAVKGYKAIWHDALKIQSDPTGFIEQTNGIIEALGNRIEKENNELYKIVDDLN